MDHAARPISVAIRANPGSGLSLEQLQGLADLLLKKRHSLLEELAVLEQLIVRRQDCSIADGAEAAGLREEAMRAAGIAGQYRQTLSEIDHAFRRLENGDYGISESTGNPIVYQRLLLVPWASTGADD